MMKTLSVILFLLTGITASAQDTLRSKKGELVLPQAGDFALQIDAVPFLRYIGNVFNKDTNAAPSASFINGYPLAIAGKYFIEDDKAYRARLRIGLGSFSSSNFVVLDGQTIIDPNLLAEDKIKTSYSNITLAVGIEKRKGKTRLQGFYGGEGLLLVSGRRTRYNYGNAFNENNLNPTRSDFGGNLTSAGWVKEKKEGSLFGIGVRGFIGAEYFFLPKLSLGFEYGWSLSYAVKGKGESIIESWDPANQQVQYTRVKTGGGNGFALDTDIANGAINLTFHF